VDEKCSKNIIHSAHSVSNEFQKKKFKIFCPSKNFQKVSQMQIKKKKLALSSYPSKKRNEMKREN
jgi:hypothetical protein